MRARWLSGGLLAMAFLAGCGGDDEPNVAPVVVMSRNLYLGAPIEPLFGLDSPAAIPAAAFQLWATVVASDIPARASAIADEIAAVRADVVGLQEATLWRVQAPPDGSASAAQTVAYDFVQLIVDELAARGFRYDAVSTSTNFDQELTASNGDAASALDVRMTDRDVILARSGVNVREAADGRFDARVRYDVAGALTLEVPRGWASVVVDTTAASFRFVDTHLEIGAFAPVQVAQAHELAALLAASNAPTIAVGDLNSNAIPGGGDNTPSYGIVTGAGFTDAWPVLRASEPGLTCCQDGGLRNPESALWERIDLILYRGPFTPRRIDVVGDVPADRTASGLWPSDHAGVVGTLDLRS